MPSRALNRTRLVAFPLALLAIHGLLAGGCTATGEPGAPTADPAGATTPPSLVGQWEGTYRFPTPEGQLVASPLRVVIERQDGEGLWGYEEFEDGGQTIRVPLTGTVDASGTGVGLSATGLVVDGELRNADTLVLRFFKVSDPASSFQATLERSPN